MRKRIPAGLKEDSLLSCGCPADNVVAFGADAWGMTRSSYTIQTKTGGDLKERDISRAGGFFLIRREILWV